MEVHDFKQSYAENIRKLLISPDNAGPLVLDLFAGCGGLALGFEAQGFETLGYEMIEDYCFTYNKNLKGVCIQSILTPGTEYPDAKVVIGGPPCQPFSVIGKQKGLKDSRDGFPAFIAAIAKVKPDIWLFENVRGLYYRNKWYLDLIIDSLRSLGYIVEVNVINTSNYGVPQNRERIVVVGHKGIFYFPRQLKYKVTAGEALGDLAFTIPEGSKFLTKEMDQYINKYEVASKCVTPRDLHLDKPSRTLTCRNLAAPTGDMMRIRLPDGRRRRLSVREAARLQSFPDWFAFTGSEESQFYQIGNSVPPLFAYQIAQSIREYLESNIRLSPEEIDEFNQRFKTNEIGPGEQMTLPLLFDVDGTHSIVPTRKSRAYSHANLNKGAEKSMEKYEYINDVNGHAKFKSKPIEVKILINEALYILDKLGVPFTDLTPRRLEKMALAFLAVVQVSKLGEWGKAKDFEDDVSMTTRKIITYINNNFSERIADSSYDDIRRKDLVLPVLANIIIRSKSLANTNDGTRGYALNPKISEIVRSFGTDDWEKKLTDYVNGIQTLARKFSDERHIVKTPVKLKSGRVIEFNPGEHNELQQAIITEFLPRYGFNADVLYVGDTVDKFIHYEKERFSELGLRLLEHEELPDVVAYSNDKKWLFLIEAVHSFGPIDNIRRERLRNLTANCACGIVYVTAFMDRKAFRRWVESIAWETEVWIAENPDHIIHFDGEKFLGPYTG